MTTYRSSAPSLIIAVAAIAGSIVAALLGLVLGIEEDPGYFPLYPLFMGATWFLLAVVIMPYIKVDADGVVTRSAVHKVAIPWSAIMEIQATSRVEIVLFDGRRIECSAVQTANWKSLFGKPGRADAVAARIGATLESRPPGVRCAPGAIRRTVTLAATWWTLGVSATLLALVLIP